MKETFTLFRLLFLLVTATSTLSANNIAVSNVTLTGATSTSVFVQFDLSWDNSWHLSSGPANWDAAWVFIKFSGVGGSGPWGHSTLSTNGHNAPSGSTITPTTDGKGAFIYRSANGSGTNTWTGVKLKWDFSLDGLTSVSSTVVQVFAIEMVHVPQGEFAAGTGGTGNNEFTLTTINTANATTTPSGTGSLGGQAGGYPTGQTAPVQTNWPNGYHAFYIMKYEVSQGQWIAFFNTLTISQMSSRDITANFGKGSDGVVNRNTVSWTTGFATTATPDRACNFVYWSDAAAYLDWAALRPMSELEFEKACRGVGQNAVPDEYAWGNTGIYLSTYSLTNDGMPTELISNPSSSLSEGNASHPQTGNAIGGPLRCGIFAASAAFAQRPLVGGSYYGVMEMSGNLEEIILNMNSGGSYMGSQGDGYLSSGGMANVIDWPVGNYGVKGGSWNEPTWLCRTSDRGHWNQMDGRDQGYGFRGVRTSP